LSRSFSSGGYYGFLFFLRIPFPPRRRFSPDFFLGTLLFPFLSLAFDKGALYFFSLTAARGPWRRLRFVTMILVTPFFSLLICLSFGKVVAPPSEKLHSCRRSFLVAGQPGPLDGDAAPERGLFLTGCEDARGLEVVFF